MDTRDTGFSESPEATVETALDMAEVSPGDVVLDLGCGRGAVLRAAARRGARGIGIDIDPLRIAEATAATDLGLSNLIEYRLGNLYTADLSEASVICMYLDAPMVEKVLMREDIPRRARVVSISNGCGWRRPADIRRSADHRWVWLWQF